MLNQVVQILHAMKKQGTDYTVDPNDGMEISIEQALILVEGETWPPEALESFILDYGPLYVFTQPKYDNAIYVDFLAKRRVA